MFTCFTPITPLHPDKGHWVGAHSTSIALRSGELLQTGAIAIPYFSVTVWRTRGPIGVPMAIVRTKLSASACIKEYLLPEAVILPSSGKLPHGRRIVSNPQWMILSKRSRISGTLNPPVSSGVNYRVPASQNHDISRKLDAWHGRGPVRQAMVGIAKLFNPSNHSRVA